jgi:uncharacterized protein
MKHDKVTPPSPFIYDRPLQPEQMIDRKQEIAELVRQADGGHSVCLYAPRRFGKTSLLRGVLAEADRQLDMIVVLVDLSEILSAADFAVRLDQAYRALRGRAARVLAAMLPEVTFTVGFPGVSLSASGKHAAGQDPLRTIHELLELPRKLFERTGRRALIVFDEFQELLALGGMDGVVRSHIQHHVGVATYFFSGSEPSMLQSLFTDRSRPLYGQAEHTRLGPLPIQETVEDLQANFDAADLDPGPVLGELVAIMNGHPQRVMLLAHRLWEEVCVRNANGTAALTAAFETMIRKLEPEMQAIWDGLSVNDRRVMSAIAYGLSPQEAAARQLTGLRSASTAQSATRALERHTFIERDSNGNLAIVDPAFAQWIARRHLPPTLYVLPLAPQEWIVTDGPSLAFTRSTHTDIRAAKSRADEYLAQLGRGGTVRVVDIDADARDASAREELPDWAQVGWHGE